MQILQTFLFADLVGFTALTDAEGDDRAADVALQLQRKIGVLLKSHGGEEVKALGDGVMLRCPDPTAAVRLGLRIVGEFDADPSFPPLRVGIHSGPAVRRSGDWYGRTVNVAARLCSVAAGGEVVVSDATRTAAGRMRRVDFGERHLHWLRNVTEPIGAYSARERPAALDSIRGAASRLTRQPTCRPARLEAV